MSNIRDCAFTSMWDDETVVITTKAKIDLNTGKVFDIGIAEGLGEKGQEVESLDREFIQFDGIDGQFDIKPFDDVSCAVCDLVEVVAAVEGNLARP